MKRNCKRKSNFLPEEVFQAFCCVINSSDIFHKDEDFKHKFNLICTFIDRIASSLRFLNSHASVPKSQEDFINFLVHCAIIRDGILKFYENILHRPPSFILEKKYFFNAMNRGMPYFTKETSLNILEE